MFHAHGVTALHEAAAANRSAASAAAANGNAALAAVSPAGIAAEALRRTAACVASVVIPNPNSLFPTP